MPSVNGVESTSIINGMELIQVVQDNGVMRQWCQSNGATEECGRYDSPSGATGTVSTTVQVSNAAGIMVNLVQLVQSVQWCK